MIPFVFRFVSDLPSDREMSLGPWGQAALPHRPKHAAEFDPCPYDRSMNKKIKKLYFILTESSFSLGKFEDTL
jgi:hypothetical protein